MTSDTAPRNDVSAEEASGPSSTATRTFADIRSSNPGRDVQRVGTARFLGQDVDKIHDPVWAVVGNLGDSQCYLGVQEKVAAVQAAMARRIAGDDLAVRLIAPAFTVGVSDGQLNGTPEMRFSLIGRELVNDAVSVHVAANQVAGLIAVVACDKPPVGTVAALLEHNVPAVILSDGSIKPGRDTSTGAPHRLGRRLPGGVQSRHGGARRDHAARVPRPGQLRRNVHLQHDADVHRRSRARTTAHGGADFGRPATRRRVPGPVGWLPS